MRSSVAETAPMRSGLPPIGDGQARVLILGSFPSEASLRAQEYYAHPRNNFWPIVESLFGVNRLSSYDERVARLVENRVAVWDVVRNCRRRGSADQAIQDAEPNGLSEWIEEHRDVRGIAFNGSTAEQTAKRRVPELFTTDRLEFKRLPSTSPANAGISLASKVVAWLKVKEWAEDDA